MLKIVLLSLFIEFGVNDIQRTVKLGYFEISLFEWPSLKMICKNKKKNDRLQELWNSIHLESTVQGKDILPLN